MSSDGLLDQAGVARRLLGGGLVDPRAVLDGKLTIADVSRRNRVLLASVSDGTSYVVKQGLPGSVSALDNEAAVLRILARVSGVAPYVPQVVAEEPGLLVLRTAGGARNWSDHHGEGRFPRIPPRVLGSALAALHALPGDAVGAPRRTDRIWGLTLPEPSYELLVGLSAGARDLLARIQASDALCDRLRELRDARSERALVHGDLRWENCLAVAAPGSRRRTRLLLIDWELAGPGAPGFDVATVFAEYLRAWLGSIPIVDPRDPGWLVASAGHPLARMRPALHAFWSAYERAACERPALRRVVELAGVRLLEIAVERAQGQATPTAHVVTLVQLADNLLRDPEDAAADLLRLDDL